MRLMPKQLSRKLFSLIGVEVRKYRGEIPDLWDSDRCFQDLYSQIKGRTIVSQDRCFMLYQLARYAGCKTGDVAEVGVYKGGTGKLIAKSCPGKITHLFDTFSGMPDENPGVDHHKKGDFSDTSFKSVQDFLKDCRNVVFHPGVFPSTASPLDKTSFSLVYVDVDIYQSVKDCLYFFYDKMVQGGIIVFDDYEWKACPGVKRAIDEFLKDKKEQPIVTARYQCMLIKL